MARGDGLRIRQPTTRLLIEYLIQTYPTGGYRTNVPLGPTLADAVAMFGELRGALASRPFRPKADAIVFGPDSLLIIEAKDVGWREGLTQLPFYRSLVATTPELAPFRGRPVHMRLVVPFTVPAAMVYAREIGVEIAIFRPQWYEQRVQDLNDYWTADATAARHERDQMRRALGLD